MPITLDRLAMKMTKRVGQIKAYEAEALSRKVRSVGRAVIADSPIDTGRFVGGWQTKIGAVPSSSPSRTGQTKRTYNRMKRDRVSHERTAAAVANAMQEEAASFAQLTDAANSIKDGKRIIYMANSVPYARTLENQGSRYGPRRRKAGFIHRSVLKGEKNRSGRLRKRVFTS